MNKQQLANKIWESANKMRSKIEANEYKDYILGFIFYKYLSDQEIKFLKENDFTEDDIKAVKYCIKSGCAVIGTAHGSGIYDTDERLAGLFGKNGFKRAVILEKCGEAGKCLDI